MDANDRRVDHSNVPVVGFCDHVHQAVPHAGLPPSIEAIVDGRWRPITLRQIGPPSSRPAGACDAALVPASSEEAFVDFDTAALVGGNAAPSASSSSMPIASRPALLIIRAKRPSSFSCQTGA